MPKLEVPPGLKFTCTQCTDCCRSWNVLLGPSEREEIEARDWSEIDPELAAAEKTVSAKELGRAGKGRYRLARKEGGSCVFLGGDNRCLLHAHFGAEAKPLICRLYPFSFYPMGDRTALDVAFSCRAVSEGHGEPVTAEIPEWPLLLAKIGAGKDKSRHLLSEKRPLKGEALWDYEFYLVRFLADRSLTILDRIRCALRFLELVSKGDPNASSAREFADAIASSVPRQIRESPIVESEGLNDSQRAFFRQILYLLLNLASENFHLLSKREQEAERRRRLDAAERFVSGQGPPLVGNQELPFGEDAIDSVDASIFQRKDLRPLELFFCAKIIGQRFLQEDENELPLDVSARRLFLHYPVAIWTSKVLAAKRNSEKVEDTDLRQALRLIDKVLGRISFAGLPKKSAEAWNFILMETDLITTAAMENM